MKKIATLLFFVISNIWLFSTPTYAASFSIIMSGADVFEGSTSITVSVGNFIGFSSDSDGLINAVMDLSYDSSKISITPAALNGFFLTAGAHILLDRATGVPAGTAILSLTVHNTGLSAGESTTISLTNIAGSDGDADVTAAPASKTISLKAAVTPAPAPTPEPTPTTPPASTNSSGSITTTPNSATTTEQTVNEDIATEKKTDEDHAAINNKKSNDGVITITTDGEGTTEAMTNNGDKTWAIIAIITLFIAGSVSLIVILLTKKRKKESTTSHKTKSEHKNTRKL